MVKVNPEMEDLKGETLAAYLTGIINKIAKNTDKHYISENKL